MRNFLVVTRSPVFQGQEIPVSICENLRASSKRQTKTSRLSLFVKGVQKGCQGVDFARRESKGVGAHHF